jgi:hypothetical protein
MWVSGSGRTGTSSYTSSTSAFRSIPYFSLSHAGGLKASPPYITEPPPAVLAEMTQFPSLEKVIPFASRMFMVEAV